MITKKDQIYNMLYKLDEMNTCSICGNRVYFQINDPGCEIISASETILCSKCAAHETSKVIQRFI